MQHSSIFALFGDLVTVTLLVTLLTLMTARNGNRLGFATFANTYRIWRDWRNSKRLGIRRPKKNFQKPLFWKNRKILANPGFVGSVYSVVEPIGSVGSYGITS